MYKLKGVFISQNIKAVDTLEIKTNFDEFINVKATSEEK